MATIQWNANLLDATFIGDFESGLNWKGLTAPGANDIAVLGPEAGAAYTVTSNPGLLALLDLGEPAVETVYGLQTAANVTLALTGNVSLLGLLQQDTVLDLTHGTAGGVNAGTIDIKNAVLDLGIPIVGSLLDSLLGASATLEISGTFDNTGTILLDQQPHLLSILGAPAQSAYLDISGSAVLTGGGHVTLTDETLNFISGVTASSTLTNVNNVISGAGELGSGQMTFINDAAGVVDATGVNALILNTQGEVTTNKGLFEALGAGGLIILDTTVNNTGGTILAGSGSAVVLSSATIIGGTLNSAGSGAIETSDLGNALTGVANKGTLAVQRGTSLTISGTIANSGVIEDAGISTQAADLIVAAAGATLSGGGIVTVADSLIYGASAAAVLTNLNNTIAGAGYLGGGSLKLINDAGGVIDSDTSGELVVKGIGAITNAGVLEATSGELIVQSAVVNTGHLVASAGTTLVEGAVTGSGTANILNGGTLIFDSSFTENVAFNGVTTAGKLVLADAVGYTGTIFDFSHTGTNSLDLEDIGFTAGTTKATYAGTASGGVLTVTDGTHTAKISLNGNYLGATFTLSSDGHGGTTVVDPTKAATTSAVPQFVSAMASFGASAAGGVHATPDAAPAALTLLVPRQVLA